MNPKQTHIMIDLETLSTRAHATILSIGAVKFNIQDGIFEEFYINVDAKTCRSSVPGLVMSGYSHGETEHLLISLFLKKL